MIIRRLPVRAGDIGGSSASIGGVAGLKRGMGFAGLVGAREPGATFSDGLCGAERVVAAEGSVVRGRLNIGVECMAFAVSAYIATQLTV